jgi:excisionase family DNA binding protein
MATDRSGRRLGHLPDPMTRAQAAKALHVSERTIDRWREKGILRSSIVGGRVLISRRSVLQALNGKEW